MAPLLLQRFHFPVDEGHVIRTRDVGEGCRGWERERRRMSEGNDEAMSNTDWEAPISSHTWRNRQSLPPTDEATGGGARDRGDASQYFFWPPFPPRDKRPYPFPRFEGAEEEDDEEKEEVVVRTAAAGQERGAAAPRGAAGR